MDLRARWRHLVVLLAASLAPPALLHAQIVERPISGDPVTTDSGRLDGKLLASGVKAYFGIPFAAPPVRELRWREPQPVQPWSGVRHADRFAPMCMQALRAHDGNHYFGEEATSEDCLYLNVWVPADAAAGANRPVLVWIYGGGYRNGSAAMADYQGESLARKGVVYVSLAYRVGALGFLVHPGLAAESPHHTSGNYALFDQIAALQWIQKNIARFGGDPGNVTISGQSAGSMSVSILQASPLAAGLFHHAVGMSGSSLTREAGAPQPRDRSEKMGLRLQEQLQAQTLTAMRTLPADRILGVQSSSGVRYEPVIDGYLLPATPIEIFAAGKQNDVPLLIGFTRDEGFSDLSRALTQTEWRESVQRLYGEEASTILKMYPAKDDAEARLAATSAGHDSSTALQMRTWARAQAATGKAPAYVYMFSRVHPYVPGITFADHDPNRVGAYHAGDVPYWLGTLDTLNLFRVTRNWTDQDRKLAEEMTDAIVAFATTGDPNPRGAAAWPKYRANQEQIRELGDTTRVIAWPNRKQLDYFAAHPPLSAPSVVGRARD